MVSGQAQASTGCLLSSASQYLPLLKHDWRWIGNQKSDGRHNKRLIICPSLFMVIAPYA
jgi:hypothetical protein